MRVFLCPLAAGLTIFSATAYAGALGNEPAQIAAPAPDFGGAALYFTLHGGVVFLPDVTADLSPDDTGIFHMTPGYRVGGSIGYDFSPNFGIEGEVSDAGLGIDSVTFFDPAPEGTGSITGNVNVLTLMGNLIFGHQWGALRPYVGVGAGGARVAANVNDFLSGVNDSAWTWGAQAFAGIDFTVTRNVSLGARYRFQYIGPTNMSDGDGDPIHNHAFTAHSIEAVLKMSFGG